jgi:hypothetical protein
VAKAAKENCFVSFKKSATHERDSISGLHVQNDKANVNGEFSVNQLRSLMDSRQAGIKDAITKDCTATHPKNILGPTDVSSKGQDRYGVSVTPGKQKAKEAPRSNSKQSKLAKESHRQSVGFLSPS